MHETSCWTSLCQYIPEIRPTMWFFGLLMNLSFYPAILQPSPSGTQTNKQTNAGRNTIALLEVMNERRYFKDKIIAINRKSSTFGVDKVKLRKKSTAVLSCQNNDVTKSVVVVAVSHFTSSLVFTLSAAIREPHIIKCLCLVDVNCWLMKNCPHSRPLTPKQGSQKWSSFNKVLPVVC